jgi:hypothetical protein
VNASTGEFPQEPGVDGAAGEFATPRSFTRTGNIFKKPGDLCGGKIRVGNESGLLAQDLVEALSANTIAEGSCPAALPDDRIMDRLARGAVPEQYGFTLIGDSDCREIVRAGHRFRENLASYLELRFPNLLGVMLDPTRLGIVLREFPLGEGSGPAIAVEKNGTRTRCPLIQRQNVERHWNNLRAKILSGKPNQTPGMDLLALPPRGISSTRR